MPSNIEIRAGIKALSGASLRAPILKALGLTGVPLINVESSSWSGMQIVVSKSYETLAVIKVTTVGVNKVKLVINFAGTSFVVSVEAEVTDTDTPLAFFKALMGQVSEFINQEPAEGEVKAFITEKTPYRIDLWACLPADSAEVTEDNGKHWHVELSGLFIFYWKSQTGRAFTKANSSVARNLVNFNGEYYSSEVMTPIYHNAIPFDRVQERVPSWVALTRFQSVMVDGEKRYINLTRPQSVFFERGLHSYSTRIETVVPEASLFQYGKTDLYAKRDKDETPFLGWELEACTNEGVLGTERTAMDMKARLPFLVMAKSDSSISPAGFETVSVPATLDFWKESALGDALDAMRVKPYNMRAFKHSSCGFHVHVSRAALSVLDLQKMERFMHNPANRPFLEAVAGRPANTYQNYTDALFNDRKSLVSALSRSGDETNPTVERVQYFLHGREEVRPENLMTMQVDYVSNCRRYYGVNSGVKASRMFYSYCSDSVSFQSMNQVTGNLFDGMSHSDTEAWSESGIRFIKKMCEVSPFFRWKFDQFFDAIRDQLPSITYDPTPTASAAGDDQAWKASFKRSSAPLGRKNSFAASQIVKGAVGKGYQRYDVLNTKNANTVEFRLFKGTMNPVTIFRYLEFVDALTRFVAMTSATDQGVNFETFINWLMKDTFNISRYDNLVSFLVENKFCKRESIRRRFLPEAKPEDGDLNVTPKPKPLRDDEKEVAPLYAINTLNAEEVAQSTVASSDVSVEWDEEPEYDEEDEESYDDCGCDDCRRARGEDFDD